MAETIRALEEAENIAKEAGTSKKDKALRKEEVGKGWGEGLIRSVAAGGEKGVEEILRDPGGCLLVGELMLYGDGGKGIYLPRGFFIDQSLMFGRQIITDSSSLACPLPTVSDFRPIYSSYH